MGLNGNGILVVKPLILLPLQFVKPTRLWVFFIEHEKGGENQT